MIDTSTQIIYQYCSKKVEVNFFKYEKCERIFQYTSLQYKESVDLKNKLTKGINAIAEQSDDLIEKIRDELRHKKDEEKRRIETCKDVQQQISALEEQFNSMAIDSQDQDDLQVRKKR